MKKILSIFLTFTIMFLLSACAGNSSQEDTSSNNTGETQTSNVSSDNILIAYFSYPLDDGVDTVSSASRAAYEDGSLGNTNYIARLIQNETGGTLFEIEPEDGFYPTDSFEALAEQTRNEVEDGVRPTIQTSIDNLDDYDVILLDIQSGGMICHRSCILSLNSMILPEKRSFHSQHMEEVSYPVQ